MGMDMNMSMTMSMTMIMIIIMMIVGSNRVCEKLLPMRGWPRSLVADKV